MYPDLPYLGDRWKDTVRAGLAAVRDAYALGRNTRILRAESALLFVTGTLNEHAALAPCSILGHDFGPVVYVSPAVMQCCHRCGRDIQGRDFDDLEPTTEADRDILDELDLYYEQGDA